MRFPSIRPLLAVTGLLTLAGSSALDAQTRLLRQPTVSAAHVAFSYANNI